MKGTRFFGWAITLSVVFGAIGCGGPGNTSTNSGTPSPSPSPKPAVVDCNTAGHDDILKAIYGEIENTKGLPEQLWQFNITEAQKTVTIVGYSAQRDDILQIVTNVAKGCTVSAGNFVVKREDLGSQYRATWSCQPGYFACGDVCIPNGETCKLTGMDSKAMSAAPANTAAPKAAKTP